MRTTGDIELIREPYALRDIEDAWRDLAVARSNAFVAPEWFWAWQRHYGSDQEPLVPVLRDTSGALLGLLPLVTGGRRNRIMRFAGSSLGDHFHPVALPEHERALAEAFGPLVAKRNGGLPRAIIAENVDADAAWWRLLHDAAGFRGSPLVDRRTVLSGTSLAGQTWEQYLGSRSRNFRSQLGRKRRGLERDHDVAIRWTEAADDLGADMALLFRLHDLRWSERSGESSLTSPRARSFHADFAAAARELGWLRLAFLEVDSQPVAAWYGWRVGDRFCYYQAGFDPAWSDRSVGLLLFAETIRTAADEGAAYYDMLLGTEQFKSRFADKTQPVCTAMIASPARPARLMAATEAGVRRAARRIPDSIAAPAKSGARGILDRLPMARRR